MNMLAVSNTSMENCNGDHTASHAADHSVLRLVLGPLETQVMEVLWACGECRAREVMQRMDRSLAYTTIMSTLDRLFRKNLVSRRLCDRAYIYAPLISCQEWIDRVARDVVAKLLAGPRASREALVACLLEAAGDQEDLLLGVIERRVRRPSRKLNDQVV
jgi:predicted transcriptional regulator